MGGYRLQHCRNHHGNNGRLVEYSHRAQAAILGSFGLFTLGSILCGTAGTFHQVLIYRVVQGIGGGALIPVSQAILRESFPEEEQGMARDLIVPEMA
ncbi:MAG: MFS transporter [Desulfoferrobacter sp.]